MKADDELRGIIRQTRAQQPQPVSEHECPTCRGHGHINHRVCPSCEGEGEVFNHDGEMGEIDPLPPTGDE
jgi:DnaJ-class molecular chaperone